MEESKITVAFWFPFGLEIAVVVGSYLLGGINSGYYLVRVCTGRDIREIGSGTAGSSNTFRIIGARGFALSVAGDAAKGAIAVLLALYLELDPWGVTLVMIAVVAGHIWPAQLGLRGGKGLATAFGAALIFDYWLVVVLAAFAIALFFVLRERVIAGLVPVAVSPAVAAVMGHSLPEVVGVTIAASLVLFAHRANIRVAMATFQISGE